MGVLAPTLAEEGDEETDSRPNAGVTAMFLLSFTALVLFGATTWLVLDRPVSGETATHDRTSFRFLSASAVVLVLAFAYGLHSLL